MRTELLFQDGSTAFDLIIRARGEATVQGFDAYLREALGDPRWRAGMNILADFTDLDLSSLSAKDIQHLASMHEVYREQLDSPAVAVVAGRPVNFGLVRMWEAIVEGRVDLRTRPFYTVNEAEAWISQAVERDRTP